MKSRIKGNYSPYHVKAVEKGEKREPINNTDESSKKFMQGFYPRNLSLKRRCGEYTDRGCI